VVAFPLSSANASEIIKSRTEMIQWDPDRAYNGYNAFVTSNNGYLVDMEGYIVNVWEPATDTGLSRYVHALENGRWRFSGHPSYAPGGVLTGGGVEGRLEEYTWEGNRVWWMDAFDGTPVPGDPTAPYTDATYRQHHDWQRMYNSAIGEWTYMALIWYAKGEADADNLGVDPALESTSRGTGATWSPDALVEILPNYATGQGGDIIWYWNFADHMVTTDPGGRATTGTWTDWAGRTAQPPLITNAAGLYTNPQLLNVNGLHNQQLASGPRRDMQHCNSIDYDEGTGYVAINAKANSEFFVVDHDGTFDPNATANDWDSVGALAATSLGDFVYRFGMPAAYDSGKEFPGWGSMNDGEMTGIHDIQWIWPYHWRPPMAPGDTWADPASYGTEFALKGGGQHPDDIADGSQGEQHFLLFDNACWSPNSPGSYILEIDPYEDGGTAISGDSGFQLAGNGYIDPADLGRRAQVPWTYGGGRNGAYDFYSSYISGTTRMPNGNTIICSGANSHFFEVEAGASGGINANDVVWEYIVPQSDDGVFQTTFEGASGTFRFHRFSSSHPALAGKNLRRFNTLTGTVPGTSGDVYLSAPTGWGTGSKVGSGGGGGGSAAGAGSGGY